ncbi:MAG: hydroxyphenylacetyl-CoA thioesterase PaaI [Betaproteobacteria bacterium]
MPDAPTDAQQLAEAVGHAMFARDLASRTLGMQLLAIRPGFARVSMVVRPDMCNGHLICHGGLIFTLADSTFAFACNSYNHNTVALGCTIDFMAPGKNGDVLTAIGEMRQQGSRAGLYDVAVTNQDGTAIALFRGKSYRIKGTVLGEATARD